MAKTKYRWAKMDELRKEYGLTREQFKAFLHARGLASGRSRGGLSNQKIVTEPTGHAVTYRFAMKKKARPDSTKASCYLWNADKLAPLFAKAGFAHAAPPPPAPDPTPKQLLSRATGFPQCRYTPVDTPVPGVWYHWADVATRKTGRCVLRTDGTWQQAPGGETPVVMAFGVMG